MTFEPAASTFGELLLGNCERIAARRLGFPLRRWLGGLRGRALP